jgi:hypothetical protein
MEYGTGENFLNSWTDPFSFISEGTVKVGLTPFSHLKDLPETAQERTFREG